MTQEAKTRPKIIDVTMFRGLVIAATDQGIYAMSPEWDWRKVEFVELAEPIEAHLDRTASPSLVKNTERH